MQEPVFQVQTEEEAYTLLKRNRVILHNLNSENPENNPSLDKRIEVTDNASYPVSYTHLLCTFSYAGKCSKRRYDYRGC